MAQSHVCLMVGLHVQGIFSEIGDPVRLRYSETQRTPSRPGLSWLQFSVSLASTASWSRQPPAPSPFYECVSVIAGPFKNSYQVSAQPSPLDG